MRFMPTDGTRVAEALHGGETRGNFWGHNSNHKNPLQKKETPNMTSDPYSGKKGRGTEKLKRKSKA